MFLCWVMLPWRRRQVCDFQGTVLRAAHLQHVPELEPHDTIPFTEAHLLAGVGPQMLVLVTSRL